jgi:hypothetical protein
MPEPWEPPPMMYPPCPPWAGWYGPWTTLLMHFHPGRSEPAQGFGHEVFYAGDGRYGHIGHQQDRRVAGHETQTVQNAKSDHPVSQEAVVAPGRQHKLETSKSGSSPDQSGGSQGQTRPRSKTSTIGEAKPEVEGNLVEATLEQNKVLGKNTETRTEVGTSSWPPQNRTVRFPNLDHPFSVAPGQKQPSRTAAPGTAPAPRRCPPGLTPSQRRRIQQMRAQKMREEVAEKETDEYFNII